MLNVAFVVVSLTAYVCAFLYRDYNSPLFVADSECDVDHISRGDSLHHIKEAVNNVTTAKSFRLF